MLSMPPATMMSASPRVTACAASTAAFRPEPQACRKHMAEDHLIDLLGRELRPLDRLADRNGAELGGGLLGERPTERRNRGTRSAHDDCLGHERTSLLGMGG